MGEMVMGILLGHRTDGIMTGRDFAVQRDHNNKRLLNKKPKQAPRNRLLEDKRRNLKLAIFFFSIAAVALVCLFIQFLK